MNDEIIYATHGVSKERLMQMQLDALKERMIEYRKPLKSQNDIQSRAIEYFTMTTWQRPATSCQQYSTTFSLCRLI